MARSLSHGLATTAAALLLLLLCGCGPDVCKCLAEAKKDMPDQGILQRCRDTFADMDEAELQAQVEKCAAK